MKQCCNNQRILVIYPFDLSCLVDIVKQPLEVEDIALRNSYQAVEREGAL
jgi:hypothetical protein